MSRLYLDTAIDGKHGTSKHCANEEISLKILWGSPEQPQIALIATVLWKKDAEEPTVVVTTKCKAQKGTEIHEQTDRLQR